MLKRPSLIFLTTICCLLFSTHYVFALNIDYSQVLRDNIVHESGAFSGETDRDVMKASVQLSGVSNPNDYRIHLTSSSGIVDTYLASYRNFGGGTYEYVNQSGALGPPGAQLGNVTYNFEVLNYPSGMTTGVFDSWYIPPDAVTNPIDIPTWTAFSGDLLNPTISWDATFGIGEGTYKLRIYELNPDGSFNYRTYIHSTPQFETNSYNLLDYTLEYGKSYAIGVQSRLNLGAGTTAWANRSQYYARYDTAPVPEPTTILLLSTGLVCLVGLGRKKFLKGKIKRN